MVPGDEWTSQTTVRSHPRCSGKGEEKRVLSARRQARIGVTHFVDLGLDAGPEFQQTTSICFGQPAGRTAGLLSLSPSCWKPPLPCTSGTATTVGLNHCCPSWLAPRATLMASPSARGPAESVNRCLLGSNVTRMFSEWPVPEEKYFVCKASRYGRRTNICSGWLFDTRQKLELE